MRNAQLLLFLYLSCSALNAETNRPFFTEKTQFEEGDRIYFVGVASNALTIEQGRLNSYSNAKDLLASFLNTESKNLRVPLKTQRTYEEQGSQKNTFNVWELTYVTKSEMKVARNTLQEATSPESNEALELALDSGPTEVFENQGKANLTCTLEGIRQIALSPEKSFEYNKMYRGCHISPNYTIGGQTSSYEEHCFGSASGLCSPPPKSEAGYESDPEPGDPNAVSPPQLISLDKPWERYQRKPRRR